MESTTEWTKFDEIYQSFMSSDQQTTNQTQVSANNQMKHETTSKTNTTKLKLDLTPASDQEQDSKHDPKYDQKYDPKYDYEVVIDIDGIKEATETAKIKHSQIQTKTIQKVKTQLEAQARAKSSSSSSQELKTTNVKDITTTASTAASSSDISPEYQSILADLAKSGRLEMCNYCDNTSLDLIDGMMTCRSCNQVNYGYIDQSAEWNNYTDSSQTSGAARANKVRCGRPIDELMPKASMCTHINGTGNEAFRRVHTWESIPYDERVLIKNVKIIQNAAQKGNLPSVIVREASVKYKQIRKTKIFRGDSHRGVLAACLYYACRNNKATRSDHEIAEMFNIDIKRLSEGKNKYESILGASHAKIDDKEYIGRYCSELGIGKDKRQIIELAVYRANKLNLTKNNTPLSTIGVCILMTNNKHDLGLTRKEIAVQCNISVTTITKIYNRWKDYESIILMPLQKKK